MFHWTRKMRHVKLSQVLSNIVLTVPTAGIFVPYSTYVYLEVFSHFLLKSFLTHCWGSMSQCCSCSLIFSMDKAFEMDWSFSPKFSSWLLKAPYQCSSVLLVLFFNLRQKCNTCKNLARLNALLERFMHEPCTECIALQESSKECIFLQDSCSTFMFCKILARILQVTYHTFINLISGTC